MFICLNFVLSRFLVSGTKYLTPTAQRKKGLFWLLVLGESVHGVSAKGAREGVDPCGSQAQ